jgi:plasmid maintenance system killer protein
MNIIYSSNKLRRQMATASERKKAFGPIAVRLSARLDDIEAAATLAVLQQIRAANCHMLTGNRQGQWAVMITGNYRMIFILNHDPVPLLPNNIIDVEKVTSICITEIGDYH